MEEEEHTDRKLQLAAISQKLNKIKKSLVEGMREKKIPRNPPTSSLSLWIAVMF